MTQQSALYPILWACTSSWYFGFHLSELNFPSASLMCTEVEKGIFGLQNCLDITIYRYGLITALFTVGGLVGSLASSWLVQSRGVKGGITITAWLNVVGALAMAFAPNWIVLALGRFIVGLSSGAAICLVPPFLALIAKSSPSLRNRSGQIGTLNQMGIVIGLFTAQVAGLALTGKKGNIPGKWRYIVVLSGIVALLQVFAASVVQSPSTDEQKRSPSVARAADPEADEGSPLLDAQPSSSSDKQMSIRELLSNSSTRGPTILCAAILGLQQLSGVNAVMFYSTPVLKPILPTAAGLIGLQITGINALMTVVAIFLVDRLGRRPLLLASAGMMAICSALLAHGLDSSMNVLSATAIILFIVGFSFGLGPIPFILVSEMVPSPGIPALASLSLSLNWVANFFIAMFFLPLRDALASPPKNGGTEREGVGRVFYVFTAVCTLIFIIVWRGLGAKQRGE
ncbi:vacuolar membrane protein [Kockovaella imperatae]|uniref:Vacuolar membrane protein n=1 Tax=Kockovaella imperatae TaxID=4999 RepID=A0A1Y1USL9_9TREE|nr:vacuolar membrane protein [Kockovaella imperatae]ORX40195.1 vacuolar membrane protein [Kockovaella imperatae]